MSYSKSDGTSMSQQGQDGSGEAEIANEVLTKNRVRKADTVANEGIVSDVVRTTVPQHGRMRDDSFSSLGQDNSRQQDEFYRTAVPINNPNMMGYADYDNSNESYGNGNFSSEPSSYNQTEEFRRVPVQTLRPGTIVPSELYPNAQSIVLSEEPIRGQEENVLEERVHRDYEFVSVARPVDYVEKVVEVPTRREVQTILPRVQVREVVREIESNEPQYREHRVPIPHRRVVDKYVEKPFISGKEIKYVPKIEVHERFIQTTKPEIKWTEKIIEVPQIKEVVRYIASNTDVEQVIRYVPKPRVPDPATDGQPGTGPTTTVNGPTGDSRPLYGPGGRIAAALIPDDDDSDVMSRHIRESAQAPPLDMITPRQTIPLGGGSSLYGAPTGIVNYPLNRETPDGDVLYGGQINFGEPSTSLPPSPRMEKISQLVIPRMEKIVEVEKEVPVTVDVPVPFMVPKPVQIPVEVPVLKFRDHFVPVPVRRHVIPRIVFTDEVYEVQCVKEKPVLVMEDHLKPVPVDVKIKLKEKDIKIIPIDPAELSQADFHAMWMRVNADLLDRVRDKPHNKEVQTALRRAAGLEGPDGEEELPEFEEIEGESPEDTEARRVQWLEERKELEQQQEERRRAREESSVNDPETSQYDGGLNLGPLPLHPGHPLLMTYLQNQWIQNPSTVTHNMYTPEMFRLHAGALDATLHPQPHQVNVTAEQNLKLGPLPPQQLPCPWAEIAQERPPVDPSVDPKEQQRQKEEIMRQAEKEQRELNGESEELQSPQDENFEADPQDNSQIPEDDGIEVKGPGRLSSLLCCPQRTHSRARSQSTMGMFCCCSTGYCPNPLNGICKTCGSYPVAYTDALGYPVYFDSSNNALFQIDPATRNHRYFDSEGQPLQFPNGFVPTNNNVCCP